MGPLFPTIAPPQTSVNAKLVDLSPHLASPSVAAPPLTAPVESTHKPRLADSEKITINLGFVDLGQIDLLVAENFYSNRTDFIRTAIRNQLATHADVVKQVTQRRMLVLGAQHFSAADLRKVVQAGEQLQVRVLGLASIDSDVTADLALAAIGSISVLGSLQASREVRQALADRQC